MDDETRRALAAYFMRGSSRHAVASDWPGHIDDQPADSSGPTEHDGKRYIVLRNVNGILAVYRVRTSGALKRLARWPAALEG
jgi:hypothetical protein